jgi:hypothetical protein
VSRTSGSRDEKFGDLYPDVAVPKNAGRCPSSWAAAQSAVGSASFGDPVNREIRFDLV